MNDIEELKKATEAAHGCNATHSESVPVKETFQGETVWEGTVEVFDIDHDEASQAYAWQFPEDGDTRYVAILGKSSVDTPSKAVQAYIVSQSK